MAPRAFLADRTIEVDVAKSLVRFTPVRWPVVLVVPCLIATPAALFWVQAGGTYALQRTGWAFALGYLAIAIGMTVVFLSPANRPIEVDLANRRLLVRKPFGRGIDLDEPLENLDVAYSETEIRARGTVAYTGKLTATCAAGTYCIAHLSGKGATTAPTLADNIDVARQLAVLVRKGKAGADADLGSLESAATARGHRAMLRSGGVLVMRAFIGLVYAYAAASGHG